MTSAAAVRCSAVTVAVPGRTLVRELQFALAPGRMLAVLGRNGSGKSSVLHSIAGLRAVESGTVAIAGRPLDDWPRRDLARMLGLLPQMVEDPFPTTALEAALVGRHPHLDFWAWESTADRELARRALAAVDLAGFDERDIATLSGGERRRLSIATILAQDPAIFLLDEPIHQLDPQHQLAVLRRFRGLADAGRTVVVSLHDVGLAARFADCALLLHGDGRWEYGDCETTLSERSIGELYGIRVRELRWEGGRTFVAA
ncbi:MAG TPA: ABC transporter ATP-binding protein [Steroidobacteraceae bacterium]|nr:ABC transporter ATP-binding protein [Steroidobacteraceae bacterium]